VKPSALFAEMADQLELTCKAVYREEDLSLAELDEFADRVLVLIEKQRKELHERTNGHS
jgi:hypothetical protein